MSDRINGIKRAIEKVFTHYKHGYRIFHLLKNVKNKFKDLTKKVKWKLCSAAKAYMVVELEMFMIVIDEENLALRAYLHNVGQANRHALTSVRKGNQL